MGNLIIGLCVVLLGTLRFETAQAMIQCDLIFDIQRQPRDDAPRLKYATALEEQEFKDRAEFIRLQIELENLRAQKPKDESLKLKITALENRLEEIFAAHRSEWLGGVRGIQRGIIFRRGFIERARMSFSKLLSLESSGSEAASIMTSARLETQGPPPSQEILQRAASSKLLHYVTDLDLQFGFGKHLGVETFLEHFSGRHLKHLTFTIVRDEHLFALASWRRCSQLKSLSVTQFRVSEMAIEKLVFSPYIGELESLTLAFGNLSDLELLPIARAPKLTKLTVLDISHNPQVTAFGLTALYRSRYLWNLKVLKITTDVAENPDNADILNALRDRGVKIKVSKHTGDFHRLNALFD